MAQAAKPALVRDVMSLMEDWAPAWTAEDWDRVGLVTGRPDAPADLVWVALELSGELLRAALAGGVRMLLVHHPPLFKPLADLRSDRPATARLIDAAAHRLAVFAAHTNLDAAPGGVNDALAQRLGLVDTAPLVPAGAGGQAKLATFAPPEHLEAVARALFAAGAGRIGHYRECGFSAPGRGMFLAPAQGRPFLGRPGGRERVAEERLEVVLPQSLVPQALTALRAAHPYEEPAVDVYPLLSPPAGFGLGRVGRPPQPVSAAALAAHAARELGSAAPAWCGPDIERVERVAVVGGSGGDLLAAAAAAGAQALITGEARHHAAEQAADLGLALITLGHYETESVIIAPWAERLGQALAAAGLSARVQPWNPDAGPWRPVANIQGG